MSLTAAEARVLEHLDLEEMLAFLTELVSIPSVGGNEGPAQERVAAWMRENGLEVDRWELDLPALTAHPAYSAEVERGEGLGVVGWLGEGREGRTLILNGHVDVVPPGDLSQWSFPPFQGRVEGGRVWGRGALDMKGGLACALFAARAIRDAGVRLRGRLMLQSVIGEEDGGMGTLATILRGHRGDGAIIMEPTGLAVSPAQAGALNFRITVRGRAAHGCVRKEGVSALEMLWPVHRELLALEAEKNDTCYDPLFEGLACPFPLSVGTVTGGDWPSSVPDLVSIEGRYGFPPDEGVEEAREALRSAVLRAGEAEPWLKEHPPEVEWWGGTFLPARTASDDPLVGVLMDSIRSLGLTEHPLRGVPFGSDMRLLVREAAIPTVHFGPGDIRNAHGADESVAVEELEQAMRALTLTTLRFCGWEADG